MGDPPTREDLIRQLQEIAARLGVQSVARTVYLRQSGVSERTILNHFDSWNAYVAAAGLEPYDRRRLDDDELFSAMLDAFSQGGGIVTRLRFRKLCRHSESAYVRRWGRWESVLRHFRMWAEQNAPEFPYLTDLPSVAPELAPAEVTSTPAAASPAWKPTQTTQLGPFLNFRGLQHAPINEQGVVFLFGMVAVDLGYVVEGVGTGFPDCEAKRCVSTAGDKWERVRVEFEYRSRNFRDHGHDPTGCDLVVCWEHNWPKCPVEVLELRTAVARLAD